MASSSSNLTTSSALSASPPTPLTSVHHLITIKLTRDNYLLWKAQIVPYLRGQHLFTFLDGSRPASPLSLPTQLTAATAFCSTSRDVWLTLKRMFTSNSCARIMQIHYQLATLRKGNSPIAYYFHRFTNLADTLAAVDHPLNDFEMISFLLVALGSDYDSFVTLVNTRVEPLSIEDLYGHLLAHELRLIQNQPSVDLSVAAANYAHKGFPPRGGRGGHSPTTNHAGRTSSPGQHTNRGRGRGRGNSSYNSRPICQALLATPQPQYDNNWYSDTGATHHLTSDLSNLNVRADNYTGTEQIRVERFFNAKIKSIQSDWGGEYRSISKFFQNCGIVHHISCPHTHQQNGSIEHKHHHVVESGLALLSHAHAPLRYWDDAFQSACYLINRLPTSILNFQSPFKKLFNTSPDYLFPKTFGCACWPNLRPYNTHKLQPCSSQCVFLGYSLLHKGYKCLHLPSGRLYISRDVIFEENNFPFQKSSPSSPPISSTFPSTHQTLAMVQSILPSGPCTVPHRVPASPTNGPPLETSIQAHSPSPQEAHATPSPTQNREPISHTAPVHNIPKQSQTREQLSNITLEISTPIEPLSTLNQAEPSLTSTHPMTTRSKNQIHKPHIPTDGTVRYSVPKALIAIAESSSIDAKPTYFTSAVKSPAWRKAINLEFDTLLKNQTWQLVPPHSSQNLIGCKWVFRTKRKADGSVERHKTRLVAKGFHQQPRIDYDETYSPIVKPTTVHTVLSIAISSGWPLCQIDIQNAFLHDTLMEQVFMTQPPGYHHPSYPHHVCKLQKALYGLKQAPRAWFSSLSTRLIALGFHGSRSDSSLFIYKDSGITMYVLIYVDDIIITCSKPPTIDAFLHSLTTDFAVKDLGNLNFFLGVEVIPNSQGAMLSQQRYILDLLTCTKMVDANLSLLQWPPPPVSLPLMENLFQIIPCFAIYRNSNSSIHAFSDADWAGSKDGHRSTGSYCVFLGYNLISSSCKKQATVAQSSTEAKYKALANAAVEVKWLQSLLLELGFSNSPSPILWCDNIGATYLSSNPIFHARTKHVEIDFHFVRDMVATKTLNVHFVSTHDQLADLLTKPISSSRFSLLRSKLNVFPIPFSLRGRIKDLDKPNSTEASKIKITTNVDKDRVQGNLPLLG
uniref:Integrase catalytic domain-containing protein n=1 Tax=Fagus sylvatica TaxID=28930 RepID=A0A2N9E6L3_FAGSY